MTDDPTAATGTYLTRQEQAEAEAEYTGQLQAENIRLLSERGELRAEVRQLQAEIDALNYENRNLRDVDTAE
jgi:uncharacterized coiled-coil DUF342 family protein